MPLTWRELIGTWISPTEPSWSSDPWVPAATGATLPHLAVPFRFGADGNVAVVEQDSLDDVGSCVAALVMTVRGERVELPDYGLGDQTFRTTIDLAELNAQLARYEPRADVTVNRQVDSMDDLLANITLTTRVA